MFCKNQAKDCSPILSKFRLMTWSGKYQNSFEVTYTCEYFSGERFAEFSLPLATIVYTPKTLNAQIMLYTLDKSEAHGFTELYGV